MFVGEHTCVTCALTQGGLHTSCGDRLDDFRGAGGLLQVGGPVADALWLQGFGVAFLTLCLVVGGKQKKERNKNHNQYPERNEHSMPSLSRVHRTKTHTVLPCATAPLRHRGSSAAVNFHHGNTFNVDYGSGVRFLLPGQCEHWRWVDRRLHLRRGTDILDWECSTLLANSTKICNVA